MRRFELVCQNKWSRNIYNMDAKANTIAALSFISIILLLPTFCWHCSRKNIADICLMIWLILINAITFINVLIWSGEDFYHQWQGQVYCDIVTRLSLASSPGKLAAIMASILNLYMILSANNPKLIEPNSRYKKITQLCICLISPIYVIVISFFIQTPRYVISRYTGCMIYFSPNVVSLILYNVYTTLWIIPTVILAVLTLRKYFIKRRDLRDILKCTNSGLSNKRFSRLLIFTLLIILVMTPLVIFTFAYNVRKGLFPYNWPLFYSDVWDQVYFTVADASNFYFCLVNIGLSFITFIVLGLGSEAIDLYKSFLLKIGLRFRREPPSSTFARNDAEFKLDTPSTDNSGTTKVVCQSQDLHESVSDRLLDRDEFDWVFNKSDERYGLEYKYIVKQDNWWLLVMIEWMLGFPQIVILQKLVLSDIARETIEMSISKQECEG